MDPKTRPRLVSTVHGFNSVNAYSAIMTRGERVIAVSESIRDHIRLHYPHVNSEIIRVIPRGIDPGEYPRGFKPDRAWLDTWGRQYPQLRDKRVLTLPGRLTRLKGHEHFLLLLQKLSDAGESVHGLIVGGAHERKKGYFEELKSHVSQAGLVNHLTFTGHRSDLREILAVSDVVFSLSTQPESFGRTTLEALAIGRPVVAYDHGGVGEQLRAMFPAGRVPMRDAAALLQTTRLILANPAPPGPLPPAYTLAAMCGATLDTYGELVRNTWQPSAS